MTNNMYFTLEDTSKILDDWCQSIETLKYIEEGPHRTINSNTMTHSKSCVTLCEKSDLALKCLQSTLSDKIHPMMVKSFNKGFDSGYEKGLLDAKNSNRTNLRNGVFIGVTIATGAGILITQGCKKIKQHKENKKESNES